MSKLSAAHVATASLSILLFAATTAAQTSDQPASAATEPTASSAASVSTPSLAGASKVRIVRLSEVKGVVRMDRSNGAGFEPAITNLPVIEQNSLETETGAAEVEFEDNSSLRMAPDSLVEFPTLERMPGGTTVSSVRLVKGMAYVSLMKTAGNEFNLLFGQQSVRLQPASHVRLQLEGNEAKLAVLDGSVQIEGPSGVMDVAHKKTVTLPLAGDSEPTVAREVESNSFDSWDHNSAEYHERYASMSALNGSPYSYGVSDMMYYGAFNDFGDCGMMWRPYFASAAWEPYANGTWAWYQGAGYSWVSPYPWGWMPYNYGAWSFCPGAGWGWMPGGNWMGLNNTAFLGSPGYHGPGQMPVRPVHPPMRGAATLIAVNEKPLIRSSVASPTSFVFRKDSAGFGIPRDELGKLSKFSEHTVARGTTSTQIYMEVRSMPGERGRPAGGFAVTSIHRGSPSESSSSPFDGGGGSRGVSSASSSSSSISSSHSTSSGSSGGSHH